MVGDELVIDFEWIVVECCVGSGSLCGVVWSCVELCRVAGTVVWSVECLLECCVGWNAVFDGVCWI